MNCKFLIDFFASFIICLPLQPVDLLTQDKLRSWRKHFNIVSSYVLFWFHSVPSVFYQFYIINYALINSLKVFVITVVIVSKQYYGSKHPVFFSTICKYQTLHFFIDISYHIASKNIDIESNFLDIRTSASS